MKEFFLSPKKSVGMVVMVAVGTLIAIGVNKYFGIESKVPRSDMRIAK